MKTFWKIFKIILLVLFGLILLALIGGFIFLKNFDIKKYKPQIIEAAQKSTGRKVDFKDIDLQVSLKDGIRLNLKDFTVAENPAFGTDPFAQVGNIAVGVDILSFLNARQISIPNILIQSPQINIIRDAAGKLNVETIGPASGAAAAPSTATPSAAGAPSTAAASSTTSLPAALPAIFINSLRIENARLNYIDQSVSPALELAVSQLNVGVDHFSLTGPFNFLVEAAILSASKDFKIEGTAQLNLQSNSVRLSNVRTMVDFGLLSLDDIRRLPMLKGAPIPQVLEGQLTTTVKECLVSDKGVNDLVLDARLSKGKVQISEVSPGISLDLNTIDLALEGFSLDRPFKVALQAGYLSDVPNIDFKSQVLLDMKTQGVHLKDLAFSTDLGLWPLDQLKLKIAPLKDAPLPEKLAGQFQVAIRELAAGPQGLGSIVADLLWKDGEIVAEKAVPGVNLRLNKTNLAVKDFSLTDSFRLTLQTAYLSEAQNISIDGLIKLDQKTQAVSMKDMKIAVDLDALSLEQLKSSVAAVKDAPLPQVLGGKIVAIIKTLEAGPKGLSSILADVDLSDGKVSMKDAAPGVSFDVSQVNFAVKAFALNQPFQVKTRLAYLSDVPNIDFNGMVDYNMQTQAVKLNNSDFSVDLATLNFAQLKSSVLAMKDVPLPETLSGNFTTHISSLSAGSKGLESIQLDANWKNGAVSMKEVSPGISVAASKIDLSLKNVSLGQPFQFHVLAAYLGDQPNIDLGGTVALNMENQSVQLKDTTFKTDLSTFSMDQLRSSVASLKDVPLPQSLKGLLNVNVTEATAGPKGLVTMQTQGALSQGSIRMKELAVPIDAVDLKFQADQTNATLESLSMTLGSKGSVKAQAKVLDYLVKKDFDATLEVKDINLAEVVNQKDAPVKMEGLIFANVKAAGQAADLSSIAGDGVVEVKEAKLKDLNVLKLVLDKISVIPNLSDKVKGSLSEKYLKKLEDKDTSINKIAATIAIAAGLINVNPIDVQADEFAFNGQCQADFAQKYTLTGAFMIPKELASAMINGASELQYLRDIDGNISFPLTVSGQGAGTPTVTPDVGALMKNAVMNKGKEELGRVLRKALGGSDSPAAQNPDGTTAPEGQTSPEAELIDGIFGSIFK